MSYIVNKTDGTSLVEIADGTIDNTTSLTLFGKSFSGFGELLNENLVKLLENSSSTAAPVAPLRGELWFDTTTNQLKVYDGTSFKPSAGAKSSASAPTGPSVGDLWLNTTNNQLFVYTGATPSHQAFAGWELTGPEFTAGQTLSGFKIETVPDSSSINKVIASMYAFNTRVAILAAETFTPASLTGFAQVRAGITLRDGLGAVFAGSATSTTHVTVDEATSNTSVSVIAGKNFLRSDAPDTTTGRITVDADAGVVIGDGQDLELTVSGINATIANVTEDGDLSIKINDGGVTKTPIAITGSTGNIAVTGDVTITGNLSVSGEYENNAGEVNIINDTFVKLNTGNAEADAGIIAETSDTDDARLFYDVSENLWVAGENATYSPIIRLTDLTADGDANKNTKALKTSAAGDLKVTSLTLAAVGSDIATSDTSNAKAASIGQVAESIQRWGGDFITADAGSTGNTVAGARYVETVAPTSGQGSNGDLWFVREA